jgi:hypothetical protein
MFFHQIRQFKRLWMCPKLKHKFSFYPIGKKTTPNAHFFLGVLMCLTTGLATLVVEQRQTKLHQKINNDD